ncbi:hypothetical protein JNUCC1_02795 [Lentibacillus sp. JNUCC-1]|uniref:hypothetical protein n=1 Tax=Lentibacillus sp. JNUCC-1 TaxID=2654513 RepID=UPI0012E963DB|nr:hypothetical protein [Lentibacillus sp. JNUCC-1]MUV38923.1 hypothetical protein [Lentibacillus sp. JNUCC-1]
MNRKEVKDAINRYSREDLLSWRAHAVKCREYFLKYPDPFEVEECVFIIEHIDERLEKMER